jgi:hypothetical protein
VASQRQLEEIAARCGVRRAQDLLVAAEKLADEFGQSVALEPLIAALEQRLATPGWSDTDSAGASERYHAGQPVYAHPDESGPAAEEAEHAGSAAYVSGPAQAAPGRVSLRSLLGGRRSSEELIDEDQALANCKPLSTAVLSISREHPRASRFAPRSTPANSPPRARRDTLRAPRGDETTSPRSNRLSSSLTGSSAPPNSRSSHDAA